MRSLKWLKRLSLCVIAIPWLCISRPVNAQAVNTPFVALNAAYASAAIADGISTQRFLASGCCTESNPLLGKRPSAARLWSQGAATTAGIVLLDYWIKRKTEGTRWRWLWIVPPVAGIALHSSLAAHNFRITT